MSLGLLVGAAVASAGCTEEGHSPDCPEENYIAEDGTIDQAKFDAWRKAMEDDGCLTPIGGTWKDDGAGGQGGDSSQ